MLPHLELLKLETTGVLGCLVTWPTTPRWRPTCPPTPGSSTGEWTSPHLATTPRCIRPQPDTHRAHITNLNKLGILHPGASTIMVAVEKVEKVERILNMDPIRGVL